MVPETCLPPGDRLREYRAFWGFYGAQRVKRSSLSTVRRAQRVELKACSAARGVQILERSAWSSSLSAMGRLPVVLCLLSGTMCGV